MGLIVHMFSDDTRQYVESVADRLQERPDPAAALYDHADSLDYGFAGALEQDEWFRLPDELDGQANCHELGVYMYSVADAMDLDPRLFLVDRDEMDHVVIDVDNGGDRTVLDPLWSLYGPIDHYDDDHIQVAENPIDARTRRSHNAIREQPRSEIEESVMQLREAPERMLAGRQKLNEYEAPDGRIREWLQYRDDTVDHLIDQDTANGFYDPLVRVTYDMDDGEITDTTVTCADISAIGYSSITDETVLAALDDGQQLEPVDPAELPVETRHHIGRVTAYMQDVDGRVHDAATLDDFWDDYRSWLEEHTTDGSGFEARQRRGTLNRLDRLADEDRERFLDRLDWLRFVDDHDLDTPGQHEAEALLDTYLDRHRTALAYSKQHGMFDAVQDAVHDIAATVNDDPAREEAADAIRGQGIADAYDAFASMVDGSADADALEQYLPLLTMHPDMREAVLPVLAAEQAFDGSAAWDALDMLEEEQPVELTEDLYTATATWTFDPDTYTLTHRLTIDDTMSTHDGEITVDYEFTPTGDLDTTRVTVADTMPHADDRITFYTAETEPGDVTFGDIKEDAVDRLDTIQESGVLAAPEPSRDAPFLEKNRVATGLYSRFFIDEVPDRLLTVDERDAFHERLWNEYQGAVENAVISYEEEQFLQGQLEEHQVRAEIADELADMSVDDLEQMAEQDDELTAEEEHYLEQGLEFARETGDPTDIIQFLAEYNYMVSAIQRGGKDEIRSRVTDQFTVEKQVQHYVKKFCDAFNDWFWTDTYDEAAETMIDTVAAGITMSIPDADTIDTYTADRSTAASGTVNAINQLVDARTAWERRGPRIADRLDTLPDQYDTVASTDEQDALYGALRSVEHRLGDRRRYHDWQETADVDLEEQVRDAREQLDTITVPESLSLPDRQQERLLAQLD